ncbi:MAG: hypothetical protein CMO26_17425 [Thiotrichales bacterium]|nr:hypothetical protein [Thiotrichales bacterium]
MNTALVIDARRAPGCVILRFRENQCLRAELVRLIEAENHCGLSSDSPDEKEPKPRLTGGVRCNCFQE